MMLFYKAWRESRGRFLAGVFALVAYCTVVVFFRPEVGAPLSPQLTGFSYHQYVSDLIFDGMGKMVFVLSVIFLGLGGLLREGSRHTAAFTLALPVSRLRLVGAQFAVGLTEMSLLAVLPAALISPLSLLLPQSYPAGQALRYGLVRFVCGVFLFALSYLLSVVLKGDYVAPLACWGALILLALVAQWKPLYPYALNPLRTMAGRWNWTGSANINDRCRGLRFQLCS